MIELTDLPNSWELISLGDVIQLNYGKGLPKAKRKSGKFPVYGSNGIVGSHSEFLVEPPCIVIGRKGSIGEVNLTKTPCWPIDTTYYIDAFYEQPINYWFYQLKALSLTELNRASAIPGLNREDAYKQTIGLPPLNEQRRIVAKIEELTAHSRRAREALDDVPTLIDQFRQSVLAAAFRGDLTADWREKNPQEEWKEITLDKVIHGKPRNGYSPKPVDFPTSVKSLTLSATTSGIFKPEYFKYINEEISTDSYLWLVPGDILIQRSNTLEYVGTSAVYTGKPSEFIYPDLMMKVQVDSAIAIPEFIHYQLSSEITKKYFKANATGTAGNMPKINQKIVMGIPLLLPSLEEQKEIIRRINIHISAINSLTKTFERSKDNLELLDQSILAKAFRGDLVPQDPNDEPASVLLDRIRAEREKLGSTQKKGHSTRKKTKPESSEQLS